MNHFKVIIIGGGISGIKAAIDLYNGGIHNVLILESRPRLGGRLYTIESSQAQYDLGASWFHDCLTNPLFKKVKSNIKYYFDDGKYQYVNSKEKDIPIWRFQSIIEEMIIYINLNKDSISDNVSLEEICHEYIKKYGGRLTLDQKELSIEVVRLWAELWHGQDWKQLSGKYTFSSDHEGRNAFVLNGYNTIFQNEINELPLDFQKNNIRTDSQVSIIDYSLDKIKLTTKDQDTYTCDYLISTVPQTILGITNEDDSGYIKWVPKLPSSIEKLLPYCDYGSLGKVVFEFDSCFWPNDVERFYILSDSNWKWPTILINYQALAGISSIVALTQSPLSNQIESMTKDEIWTYFKPKFDQIKIDSLTPPRKIYHTEWNQDEFVRGAYGATFVNTIDPSEIVKPFIQGFGNIRFAGAETIDGSSNGCAHGGWLSGQREAKRILQQELKSRM